MCVARRPRGPAARSRWCRSASGLVSLRAPVAVWHRSVCHRAPLLWAHGGSQWQGRATPRSLPRRHRPIPTPPRSRCGREQARRDGRGYVGAQAGGGHGVDRPQDGGPQLVAGDPAGAPREEADAEGARDADHGEGDRDPGVRVGARDPEPDDPVQAGELPRRVCAGPEPARRPLWRPYRRRCAPSCESAALRRTRVCR